MTRAGLSRAAVVAAAADLADADGLGAVTVSAVARRVGVRTPSLYAHVAGNDALRTGVTVLALDELADRVEAGLGPGATGREALAALGAAHRAYAHAHPGRYAAAGVLDRPSEPDLARAGARHAAQALAVVASYDVPAAEQTHAVRIVAALLRGFVQLEAGGGFAHREPPADASWERALDLLDAHLRQLSRAANAPDEEAGE